MNEYKKIAYESEDTFALGKTLPVVAMRQLPKIADKFYALPDHPDYVPGLQRAMGNGVMRFYNNNLKYMDDERELKEQFKKACKLHHHSHYELRLFSREVWNKI